ncbi:MAG TPA: family 1 glycosylhydrolase [Pyrinomonadaceae bacterium]|jgi:beta-glucosidase/6-phospho-beta-glucosidase/beta-galactosidase
MNKTNGRQTNGYGKNFIFCTGIENSYPTIKGRNGKPKRIDQMEKCGHYERWRDDFQLVRELGLDYLRYGPPYYKVHLAPGKYDWSFTDETFNELKRLDIVPITDLCHFGVPDWIGNFQNPDWAQHFAEYAEAFARRYPWVRLYTPINEIFITAMFSAKYGWWNERLETDLAYVTALKHLARANLLAKFAILKVQPDAIFIQSESSEYFHALDPEAKPLADFYNEKRFLSLDLCYGHDVKASMYLYLTDNELTRAEYEWLMENGRKVKPHCVMGNDYYYTNEHYIAADGKITESGEIFGYYVITKQYYDRYHLPVMHTETNLRDEKKAPLWLRKQWENMLRLRADGVPIIGFTWYSLTDQIDWDVALRLDRGRVNPLGLYDLDRKIRPVGTAYKKLVEQWRELLPMESRSLDMHVSLTHKD